MKRGDITQGIMALLAENPNRSAREISELTGFRYDTVRQICYNLGITLLKPYRFDELSIEDHRMMIAYHQRRIAQLSDT